MLFRKSGLLPKNRVVRRTLYRLLLAAPALPLAAPSMPTWPGWRQLPSQPSSGLQTS